MFSQEQVRHHLLLFPFFGFLNFDLPIWRGIWIVSCEIKHQKGLVKKIIMNQWGKSKPKTRHQVLTFLSEIFKMLKKCSNFRLEAELIKCCLSPPKQKAFCQSYIIFQLHLLNNNVLLWKKKVCNRANFAYLWHFQKVHL